MPKAKKFDETVTPAAAPAPVAEELTYEACRAAVNLFIGETPFEGEPSAQGTYAVRRANGKAVIPIQSIMKRLRAKEPDAKFVFET